MLEIWVFLNHDYFVFVVLGPTQGSYTNVLLPSCIFNPDHFIIDTFFFPENLVLCSRWLASNRFLITIYQLDEGTNECIYEWTEVFPLYNTISIGYQDHKSRRAEIIAVSAGNEHIRRAGGFITTLQGSLSLTLPV